MANPRNLYQAVQNNTSIQQPASVQPEAIDVLSPNASQAIHDRIKRVRESGFDHIYTADGKNTLIKVNSEDMGLNAANPIDEVEVQALRYLRGMMIISNGDPRIKLEDLNGAYQAFLLRHNTNKTDPSKDLKWLHDEFAKQIQTNLGISQKKSKQQLTMARDLGIMLEEHPSVCTISHSDNQVTIETADHLKISNDYYDKELTDVANKEWFHSAKKLAGFKKTDSGTWLETFFKNNFANLKDLGVAAPPSARWLPLPANNQLIQTHVAAVNEDKTLAPGKSARFIRMGIPVSFDMKNIKYVAMLEAKEGELAGGLEFVDEQKRLAKAQLKEIIYGNLEAAINEYKEAYKELGLPESTFIVGYQTLLTPHYLESKITMLKDNNARFVEMAKEAMKEIAAEQEARADGIKLMFAQTNASVNHRGDWVTAKEFSEDRESREAKLKVTADLFNHIIYKNESTLTATQKTSLRKFVNIIENKSSTEINLTAVSIFAKDLEKGTILNNYSPELRQELSMRLQAAVFLRQALENKAPYSELANYQRNLMIASLEHLAEGKQSIKLAGCKSARDRTAIFAAAVKTMMEKPGCMNNWEELNKGIIKSLMQGHHFRAMIYHVAVVKVGDVHKMLIEQLPDKIRDSIQSLKQFSKKLGELGLIGKISKGISQLANSTMFLFEKLSVTKSSIVQNHQKDIDKAKDEVLHILQNEAIQKTTSSRFVGPQAQLIIEKVENAKKSMSGVDDVKELNQLIDKLDPSLRKKVKEDFGKYETFVDNTAQYNQAKKFVAEVNKKQSDDINPEPPSATVS